MAWRPHEYLIGGELDNRTPGKVTGWIRFSRAKEEPFKLTFDLEGDFLEDIRGKAVRLSNPRPLRRDELLDLGRVRMAGIEPVQRGLAGDITAGLSLGPLTENLAQKLLDIAELYWEEEGLSGKERKTRRRELAKHYREHIKAKDPYRPHRPYPYIEWFTDSVGRAVLELEPDQVEVLDQDVGPIREKSAKELFEEQKRRKQAFDRYMEEAVESASEENRRKGGDGNVFGAVI